MNTLAWWSGVAGVSLLLLAFVLNILHRLSETGAAYLIMNAVGAFMAAFYAVQSGAWPFVILEIVWGIAAVVRMITKKKGSDQIDLSQDIQ